VITQLGKGEALVSFLEGNGTPSMVERALIRPPSARVGPVTADERKAIIAASPLKGRYDQAIDPESAYEILQRRVHGGAAPGGGASGPESGGLLGGLGGMLGSILGGGSGRRGRMSATEVLVKQVARTVGSEVGRAVIRGVLGSLGAGKR
jgi:hypothetical protein